MNITFLIGNGFDVGVGMKSKFKDFFPIYKEKSKSKAKRIKQLSDEIEGNYETWADFEKALGEYTVKFTPETKQNFIDQVKDFETEVIAYLEDEENRLCFDESDEISRVMLEALTKYYSVNNIAPESTETIAGTYSNHVGENHVYNFINFNYTDVLKKCLDTITGKVVCKRNHGNAEKVDKIGEIVHVHGKNKLYPIIGVNDVSQIANQELAKDSRFTKRIVKPSLNKYLRLGNDGKASNIINQSTIICVYGMSLGITDKKWWNMILSWLHGNSARQLVLFDYDNDYSTATQFGWIEKEDEIIDKLSEYNNSKSIDVENLRSRIHIAVHKNIFQMNFFEEKSWISSKIPAIV